MNTFIMMTRLNSGAATSPQALEQLEQQAVNRISEECPSVKWLSSYAAMGPYDYIDIFTADNIEMATRVSTLIRTVGHAHSEVWPVIEWTKFKEIVHDLSPKI
ncbi:MAG: GYD domain-containing protein [Gammaproteobacteria bacterium]